MKKQILNVMTLLLMTSTALVSCNKDDKPNDGNGENPANGKYILLTAEWGVSDGAGYYAAYDKLPTGEVDNIGGLSLQARNYGGFRTYKNWIFNRQTLSGETGVVQYSLSANGKFAQSGFIKCGTSAQHLVVNENTGFYYDADRGKTKIQKFNPTTMERTGEIDLSAAIEKGAGISTNVTTGEQTIISKEGKLYVNITYASEKVNGSADNMRNYSLAVIDISTEKIEKVIVHPKAKNHGRANSEFPAWIHGSDGALYLLTTGWDTNEDRVMTPQNSFIFRIKAGETDFDKSWELSATDLGLPAGALLWSFRELNGKLYVDASQDKIILPALTNLNTNIYKFFEVDIKTKNVKPITNVPLTVFGLSTGNVEVVDNQVFLRVVDRAKGLNGYYKVNLSTHVGEPAFNVKRGGEASGFIKLKGE